MRKGKIQIKTTVDNETVLEKYICKIDGDTITYTDRQKTQTTIIVFANQIEVKRKGFVNYELVHDGISESKSDFKTLVEGQDFFMTLEIKNRFLNIKNEENLKVFSIEFERFDKSIVKQEIKVEAK